MGSELRQFLDKRGLIYRKLGQYLAMRTDLLPAPVCAELDHLFDAITPMSYLEVEEVVARELGTNWRHRFQSISPEPIGSASVAQVHRALAADGEELALKVQRIGIGERFEAEVRLLGRIAQVVDFLQILGDFSLLELFNEFARFTRKELDFIQEGRAADRLRLGMRAYGHVPFIRWDLTTSRLLAMEFMDGEPVLTLCRLSEAQAHREIARTFPGINLERVVARLAEECFREMFDQGFFHGDPHPGNVLVMRDGTFAFLDCGITGELSYDHRQTFRGFVENLAFERFTESALDYTRLCRLTAATDVDAWIRDLTIALTRWHQALNDPHALLTERHMGSLQGSIALAMRRHRVQTLPNQILVWRALVLIDTTVLRLPFRFDVLGAMQRSFRSSSDGPTKILRDSYWEWRQETTLLAREIDRRAASPSIRLDAQTEGQRQDADIALLVSVLAVAWAAAAHAGFFRVGLAGSALCIALTALRVWRA